MSEDTMIAFNGDPNYCNLVAIDFLNQLRWSRKRRMKWLRRSGMRVNRAVVVALELEEIFGFVS